MLTTLSAMLVLTTADSFGHGDATPLTSGSVNMDLKPYSVTLSVTDIEQMATWYEQKLGFKRVSAKEYPEFKTSLVFLESNGFRVELIGDGNAREGVRRADPPSHTAIHGVSQFAFQVTDIDKAHAELAVKRVEFAWTLQCYLISALPSSSCVIQRVISCRSSSGCAERSTSSFYPVMD